VHDILMDIGRDSKAKRLGSHNTSGESVDAMRYKTQMAGVVK